MEVVQVWPTLWNMPKNDTEECKKVWLKTKKLISAGNIFDSYKYKKNGEKCLTKNGKQIRNNNLPKESESKVCHVRPHGRDASDVFPLPIQDKKLKVMEYTKQSFWLNKEYIANIYQF